MHESFWTKCVENFKAVNCFDQEMQLKSLLFHLMYRLSQLPSNSRGIITAKVTL